MVYFVFNEKVKRFALKTKKVYKKIKSSYEIANIRKSLLMFLLFDEKRLLF